MFKINLQAQKKSKKAHLQAYKPDHPPAKPAQPTRPPDHFNGRLTDGLSVRLFSTDGQRICPKPEPPDPNPPLHETNKNVMIIYKKKKTNLLLTAKKALI
jgi:hypothetical protein